MFLVSKIMNGISSQNGLRETEEFFGLTALEKVRAMAHKGCNIVLGFSNLNSLT